MVAGQTSGQQVVWLRDGTILGFGRAVTPRLLLTAHLPLPPPSFEPPWDSSPNLNAPDRAALHFVEKTHRAEDLVVHGKIGQGKFWPRPFVRVELYVFQHHGQGIEYWLGVSDTELFDAAVVDLLAQPYQRLSRRRKV